MNEIIPTYIYIYIHIFLTAPKKSKIIFIKYGSFPRQLF